VSSRTAKPAKEPAAARRSLPMHECLDIMPVLPCIDAA
jgi:hypothetical protein